MFNSNNPHNSGRITLEAQDCRANRIFSSLLLLQTCTSLSESTTSVLLKDRTAPDACNLVIGEKCVLVIVLVNTVTTEMTFGNAVVGDANEETAVVLSVVGMHEIRATLSSNNECSALAALVAASRMGCVSFVMEAPSPPAVLPTPTSPAAATRNTDRIPANATPTLILCTARVQFSIRPASVWRERERRVHCERIVESSLSFDDVLDVLFLLLLGEAATDLLFLAVAGPGAVEMNCPISSSNVCKLNCTRCRRIGTMTCDATSNSSLSPFCPPPTLLAVAPQ
mmetsp:Transcript_944/g.2199  ORF Transcript_944/g.2199 Transcript_944/m.2199 type:complete len:283 (-) Transcript_944:72-920(-)